jgi:UDP-N-acetylglucosamine diphosphorylase / glucose-1-phosphate thymidylyltransferase / UDP-N-acetylgalactosamine diphosphorylase / glucosamine-1-phosphate N-acetyltransferase / galactosamine-1-phosphate N-acetyltransferase
MFEPERFLDFDRTSHRVIFENVSVVWQAIEKIGPYLQFRLKPAIKTSSHAGAHIGENVFIDEGTVIEPGAHIKGPAWIGRNCQIRSGCYIRENVILGDGVVAGNSSEFKNSLVFDHAEVPHFNYVGDSILGHRAHLGAGVILSNVRLDRREVVVTGANGHPIPTGLRKFGAIVGDFAEVGCNSVLSPGSILGRHAIVYPCTHWRGMLEEKKIARNRQEIDILPRRE